MAHAAGPGRGGRAVGAGARRPGGRAPGAARAPRPPSRRPARAPARPHADASRADRRHARGVVRSDRGRRALRPSARRSCRLAARARSRPSRARADGRTASLIPDDPVLDVTDRDVAVTGIHEGRRRMTLTYPILDRARNFLWLVSGSDKTAMLARLRDGDRSTLVPGHSLFRTPSRCPSSRRRGARSPSWPIPSSRSRRRPTATAPPSRWSRRRCAGPRPPPGARHWSSR